MVNMVLNLNLHKDPWKALLHKPITDIANSECVLVMHAFMATKQTYAEAWKMSVLSFDKVKRRVQGTLVNEISILFFLKN